MLALGSILASKPVLFAIGLAALGGPAALTAYLRGRSAVGWFFLGVLFALVLAAVFPKSLQGTALGVIPSILVGPIVLLLIPKRERKNARKHVEPADWSSSALLAQDARRKPEAGSARAQEKHDSQP